MNKINKMDRAISVGQSVFSVGKLFLYKFDWEYIIPKWSKNNLQLVYIDTDTIVILIKTDHVYEDIIGYVEKWYDTTNYGERRKAKPLLVGKKVVGLMEDDVCGKIITKFAATARKTYAYKVQNDDYEIKGFEFIKANEVKKSVHKELAFHGFDECVNDTTNAPITKQLTSRRSINHRVYTVTSKKIAMHYVDDKETQDVDRITTCCL